MMKNIIKGEKYRLTVLTSQLIRLEYNEDGVFEDGQTQTIVNRAFPNTEIQVSEGEDELVIHTEYLKLRYDRNEFSAKGLSIQVMGNFSAYNSTWYYGEKFNSLKGTARTLDFADGEIPLSEGLISKDGFSCFDDSQSLILSEDGFVTPRKTKGVDLYFFGYGRDYYKCLKDFYHLCGKQPVLPRYALGNWWSRFYRYSENSYLELMDKFEEKNIPFSVSVIDMDWHNVDIDPKYGSGWTGYTWNKNLFPDPERFLSELHKRKLKASLNVHPASGVRGCEEMYEEMAKALDVDYEQEETIEFDITNRKFLDAYFKYVHHPREKEGVDFWWIDWQQESHTKVEGLDPLWMLNHFHYKDIQRDGKRGLTFSRYAGIGSHRYPVGFSGDTIISWESLKFQPYFTATATNVGYGWWSHDIGGHMEGVKDDELQLRWIQFGVFSPINRLHSSCNEFSGKEPWNYSMEVELLMTKFMRLRHKFIPYLYSMNKFGYDMGRCLLHPMYYKHPMDQEAYEMKNQYYFGENLIVLPIVSPIDATSHLAETKGWLPQGIWYDYFTNMAYEGAGVRNFYRGLESMPIFVKAGTILPLDLESEFGCDNPSSLDLRVYAGANGEFSLWEDEDDENYVETKMKLEWSENPTLTVEKPSGNINCIPKDRSYRISLLGFYSTKCSIYVNNQFYRNSTEEVITLDGVDVINDKIVIIFEENKRGQNNVIQRCFDILQRSNIPYNRKTKLYDIVKNNYNTSGVFSQLLTVQDEMDSTVKALIELLSE